VGERPDVAALGALISAAWNTPDDGQGWPEVLTRSLCWVCAYDQQTLVGFVNVAWDGGRHAFLLDTTVHPDWQGQGIGTQLVREAAACARARGAHWLHVDFGPHLVGFYAACGFAPTTAGLLKLA